MEPGKTERSRREEYSDATRQALLEAGRDIFAREGYQAAGIEAISRAARVTRGAFYHHFEDKKALFDAVVDGNEVSRAKPDPEVFLKGAAAVDAAPSVCVVFEDAAAGIEAASRAGMRSVGVGGGASLSAATMRLETFAGFTFEQLAMKIDRD